ncbi:putative transcriptional regulator [Sphaerochaeta pleomorpha str. Grapes]|uniref:Putative transcriptional regulator n=1 Tax=Sphaerochaeta pleomorpha (strain ATCC BAA-1885 / DSM 22778 / Grapes) TaxID=158190 RepID=G8QUX1_SPHPG|nr:TrmB family transcriptional regulator [Sphaerochaeta pleomorpha]AEV28147.1 putative transcriptional regulator [Sphaerochaeta pleomorpha str. Grapes]
MDTNLENLSGLGFTPLEANMYITLLKEGEMSGYKLAKAIGISRSSVYAALEGMYKKGLVSKVKDEVSSYIAMNPSVLCKQLKHTFIANADEAEQQLMGLYEDKREERFTNLHGFDSIVTSVREMLLSSYKEVYLNTDFDLNLFRSEFMILQGRKVRIIVFSFASLDTKDLDIELYSHDDTACEGEKPSRIMLVVDCDKALVADTYKKRGTWLGTVTNNALFVSIVAEHIHHDIYLYKLKRQKGSEVVDETMKIDTILERRYHATEPNEQ